MIALLWLLACSSAPPSPAEPPAEEPPAGVQPAVPAGPLPRAAPDSPLGDSWVCGRPGASVDCFVAVPAATFMMGAQAEEPSAPGYDPQALPDESPVHEVAVSSFFITGHEIPAAAYRDCVQSGWCSGEMVNREGRFATFSQRDKIDVPITGVSWDGAQRFCAWMGGRLPTEAEWELAARGTDGRRFPWGNEAGCATAERDQAGRWSRKMSVPPCGSAGPRAPAELRGHSPYGAIGMAGNVWEWTADWYAPDAYAGHGASNPTGPSAGEARVQRGGGWSDDVAGLRSAGRQAIPPRAKLHDVGFRCVRSPVVPR